MKELSFTELKMLISGAVSKKEENGWLSLCRFTEKQMEYYRKTSDRSYLRACASAGMMMDFITGSDEISFDCHMKRASSKNLGFVDLYVDGVLRVHEGTEDADETEIHVSYTMPMGKKRVTVYFPCLFSSKIRGFKLDDSAAYEGIIKKHRFLFFGDSITQGYTSYFPSFTYPNMIGRCFNAYILNQAIGGEVFNEKHLDEKLDYPADTVIVAYGTNDWNAGKDIENTAAAYFEKLSVLYPNAEIFTVLPVWRTDIAIQDGLKKHSFEAVRGIIRDICARYPTIRVLDGIDYIPHSSSFMADHVHPNELGFICYTESLKKELKDFL